MSEPPKLDYATTQRPKPHRNIALIGFIVYTCIGVVIVAIPALSIFEGGFSRFWIGLWIFNGWLLLCGLAIIWRGIDCLRRFLAR